MDVQSLDDAGRKTVGRVTPLGHQAAAWPPFQKLTELEEEVIVRYVLDLDSRGFELLLGAHALSYIFA